MHVQTTDSGKKYTLHVHRQLLMVLFLLKDVEKSYVNAEMPEKVSSVSAFPPVVSSVSPASAFRHQGSVPISAALPGCCMILLDHNLTPSIVANLLHRERKTKSMVLFHYISSGSIISWLCKFKSWMCTVQYCAYYFSLFCL